MNIEWAEEPCPHVGPFEGKRQRYHERTLVITGAENKVNRAIDAASRFVAASFASRTDEDARWVTNFEMELTKVQTAVKPVFGNSFSNPSEICATCAYTFMIRWRELSDYGSDP
jgi:hypothetical protein